MCPWTITVADLSLLLGRHPHFQPNSEPALGALTASLPEVLENPPQTQAKEMPFLPKASLFPTSWVPVGCGQLIYSCCSFHPS